jgi:MYXO-CTERM domain-containing protein
MKHIELIAVALAAFALTLCASTAQGRPVGPAPAQGVESAGSVTPTDGSGETVSGTAAATSSQVSAASAGLSGPVMLSAAGLGLAALGLMASLRRKRMEG